MNVLLVYRDFLGKGGFPNDIRCLCEALSKEVSLTVHCKSNLDEVAIFDKSKINLVYFNNILKFVFSSSRSRKNYDFVIYCGFSSFYNILHSLFVKSKYVILPFSQINSFLDYDNPFAKGVIPDVRLLEKETPNDYRYHKISKHLNNSFSFLKKFKRFAFRSTLGALYLNRSSAVGVVSKYEEREIFNLYKNNAFNIFYYKLGTSFDLKIKGEDVLPCDRETIKLVFWARADFYYKGIDRALSAIKALKEDGEKEMPPIKLFVVGPDYNNGYDKIRSFTTDNGLDDLVQIITPSEYTNGTYGLLNDADAVILLSRWDGYPRTFREAFSLGIPIIASPESNFDIPIYVYNGGWVVKDTEDLRLLLRQLNFNVIQEKRQNIAPYFNLHSWQNCASSFVDKLQSLI